MLRRSALLVATLAITGVATADTAYVKPSTFTPKLDQTITAEVSFSDACCEPRYPVRTETHVIINPNGTRASPDRVETFASMTILEHTFTQQGTSRISTGERLGRKGEYVFLEGEYHLINSPDAAPIHVPEGTPILTSQTLTVSDAYVTIGVPSWHSVGAPMGRLAITPSQHPNLVKTGTPFMARVTFDGEPVAGQTAIVTTEAQRLSGQGEGVIQTGRDGVFTATFDKPGVTLLMVRLQAPAPEGAETDIRSYTTALTIEVGID